jgi:hypothetical protein
MVRSGAEQRREELVADRSLRRRAAEHEVDGEAQPRAGRRGHAAVVRLAGTDGDQGVRALGHGQPAQVLELPGLVASHPETRQVVALDPEAGTAGQEWALLQRRGQRGQRRPRPRRDRGLQAFGAHVV